MPGRYFEEFEIGQQLETGSRTVTETDVINFAGVSGDFYPLHMDEVYAKTTPFKGRIAHGMCALSIASGLTIQTGIFDKTLLAFLNMNWKFVKPVRMGDTLTVSLEVLEKKETRQKDRGIIVFSVLVTNQDKETVQEGQWTIIIARQPTEDSTGPTERTNR
jgi:acyl dehydratase